MCKNRSEIEYEYESNFWAYGSLKIWKSSQFHIDFYLNFIFLQHIKEYFQTK